MGNYTSQGTNSNNSHADNNFEALQRNIQHLVKYGGQRTTQTDTIHFNTKSTEFDVDSIKEFMQNGGSLDNLNILPRRSRYEQYATVAQRTNQPLVGGSSKLNKSQLSSIDEDDFKFLKDVLKRHNNNQSGGCGCTGAQSDNSPTSQDPVSYADMKGGAFSPTSDSYVYNAKGGNDSKVKESGVVSVTSDNSLGYDILFGGNKDKKDKKEDDLDSEDSDDEESDDEESDEESEDEEEDDEDDEDYDESADGDELSRTKGSSTSSSSSESTPELKRQSNKKSKSKKSKKLHRHHDYLNSSQSGGSSDEIVIDTKYLYSDNNQFYGSDDNSEYYGSLRNRSMMN